MGNYKTNQIMFWAGTKVSDHGRSPLVVDYERIERKSRMVKGTLRKYVTTQKRIWTTSWDNLPSLASEVVDGGMTGPAMKAFSQTQVGPFVMQLRDGQTNLETVTVMLSSFNYEILKRGNTTDLWTVSVTLEEV